MNKEEKWDRDLLTTFGIVAFIGFVLGNTLWGTTLIILKVLGIGFGLLAIVYGLIHLKECQFNR